MSRRRRLYFHVRAVDTQRSRWPDRRTGRAHRHPAALDAGAQCGSVKEGAIAYLTFEVNGPVTSAGWCTVHIVVKNGPRCRPAPPHLRHAHSGVLYQTGFRCGFAKVYRFYVYATDAAGNTQGNVAWDRLVVS